MKMQSTNSPKTLTVYKASAGSGKTFTLSKEYIKLALDSPERFRNILAVTFTNKATEEMKLRILSKLYGMSKRLPDAEDYVDAIERETGRSRADIAQRAGLALNAIVRGYSFFRIVTIDTFFQGILTGLARELDLPANLKIEVGDKRVEQEAVDRMIEDLKEGDAELQWILEFTKEKMEEGKAWNVVGEVKAFGEHIFKETYMANRDRLHRALSKKGFFDVYKARLHAVRSRAERTMTGFADRFEAALQSGGFSIRDLKNQEKGPASYFGKLKKKVYDDTVLTKCVENVLRNQGWGEWAVPSADSRLKELAEQVLTPLLMEAEAQRKRCRTDYVSADLTLRYLNQLRLIGSIDSKVKAMNAERRRFMLCDTHTLLRSLIVGSDTPFIFEKAGTQLDVIMIDEFQDTSCVQWENFNVLLKELMSHGKGGNLIVGDVKQSIYRWRSGDWRLLNNIEKKLPAGQFALETLKTNWRSERKIVEFNNAFFQKAKEKEAALLGKGYADQLTKAYDDVEQEAPERPSDGGYVRVELLPAASAAEEELFRCLAAVRTLLEAGAKQSEIAILLRKNKQIEAIADYFSVNMPEVKMVSDEAFRLEGSIAARVIVAAMRLLTHPDDMLTRAFLVKTYQTKVLEGDNVAAMLPDVAAMPALLPKEYVEKREELLSLPLFELAERLYRIFDLQRIEGEDAYLFAFYDKLGDFLLGDTADTSDDFVKEWNENIKEKTIKTSEVDGIRLLTVHKSKGLEFAHVIVPFSDWTLEQNDTFWCEPKGDPYNLLPLVPVPFYTKKLLGTVYEDNFYDEHLQNTVDNLNLLYVAFTRATQSLFVIAQRGNEAKRSYIIEESLKEMNLDGARLEGDVAQKKEALTFAYGTLTAKSGKAKELSENVFLPKTDNVSIKYTTYEGNTQFKQSNKSKDFVRGEDEGQQSYIKTGLLLHSLLAMIKTEADIARSIDQMVMDGIMNDLRGGVAGIRDMLHKRLQTPAVKEWFSGKWQVMNECDILFVNADGETKNVRPDRVMTDGKRFVVVDFKFGKPKPEHSEQVHHYMMLIKEMGYADVTGYLWYVYSNEIETVKL